MVRLVLFLFAILLMPLMIKGQITVTVDPTSFILTGHPTQTDIAYHIQVTNTSNETASIFWSKRMQNSPETWLSWICDKNLCYEPPVHSCPTGNPNVLAANESMDLSVHVNPLLVEGTCDYELTLRDINGNELAVIPGACQISNATAVKETNDLKLTVFPNPTTDFFAVTETAGLKYIEVFNIVGNKVKTFEAVPNRQYYVGDLADGIYLVRLANASKKVLKTIRLSKR